MLSAAQCICVILCGIALLCLDCSIDITSQLTVHGARMPKREDEWKREENPNEEYSEEGTKKKNERKSKTERGGQRRIKPNKKGKPKLKPNKKRNKGAKQKEKERLKKD